MKKNNIRYSKENFKKFLRFIENHRKQLVGSVATVGLTGFITLTSFLSFGCTQEEIDAANELINQLATEQTVDNPEPEVTVEPEVIEPEAVVEPEVVEPVEEVDIHDMEAMYGIKDAPKYTDEEVALAQENVKNNYDDYNDIQDDKVRNEKLDAIAADYYAANQNFFGQLHVMTKDIDEAKLSKLYATRVRYYYDEENDCVIELTKVGIGVYGKNFVFHKEFWPEGEADKYNLNPGDVINGASIMISKDGSFIELYTKDEATKKYDEKKIGYNELTAAGQDTSIEKLEEIGYKSIPMEYEYVTFFQNEEDLTLEKK